MNYTIRAMTIADHEAVLRLWRATEGIGLNESDERENIGFFLERNPGLSRVVADGADIVGALLCGHDGRRGYLHHLAIARTHRRQGLGRKLVEACAADLKRQGMEKCNVFIFADNIEGEAFWNHLGWMKHRDWLVMQKRLTVHGQTPGC